MRRLSPEVLAIHLELALEATPQRTLDNFRSAEKVHPRATAELARHLAGRLSGIEFSPRDDWVDPEAQRSLFDGKC